MIFFSNKIWLFTIVLFGISNTILAQGGFEFKKENVIELFIEAIAENLEEDVDYTNLLDDLNHYFEFPLNINTASREQLQSLLLLTSSEITSIQNYIKYNGELVTLYELNAIRGLSFDKVILLSYFLTAYPSTQKVKTPLKNYLKYGKNELFMRWGRVLEEQRGYALNREDPERGFLGDPNALFLRYRYRYKDKLSIGFTADKDAGEQFFGGTMPQGFDFYSAHLFIRDVGFVKKITIGDYALEFGQGLTMWSSLAFGKSAFTTNIKRHSVGLRPYTSANESLFMRGAAATFRIFENLELTTFYSNKYLSATVAQRDTLDEFPLEVSGFQITGLHRTRSELNRRRSLNEEIFGGHIRWKSNKWQVGLTGYHTKYSARIQRSPQLYNIHRFNGNQNTNLGIDYQYVVSRFSFFGETAMSQNGGWATINGVQAELNTFFRVAAMYRNFRKDFQNEYAAPIGEVRGGNNEEGVYIGFEANPVAKISINGYTDFFRFPWLRFRVDAPSYGTDYLLQVGYTPTRRLNMYARIRHRLRQENTREIVPMRYLVDIHRTYYRYHLTYSVNRNIQLRSRLEFMTLNREDSGSEMGYLLYQDIALKPNKIPLTLNMRYALFQTDGFDSRIYAYENDVLYFFSIPALFNRGTRFYVNLKYSVGRNLDIWLRYAQTYLNDRTTISSGNTLIDGNTRSDVRAQLRFKF